MKDTGLRRRDQAAQRRKCQAERPDQSRRQTSRQPDPLGILLIGLESAAPEVARLGRHGFHYLETEQECPTLTYLSN